MPVILETLCCSLERISIIRDTVLILLFITINRPLLLLQMLFYSELSGFQCDCSEGRNKLLVMCILNLVKGFRD